MKFLDLKASSEQIFSENCRWVPLTSDESEHNTSNDTIMTALSLPRRRF